MKKLINILAMLMIAVGFFLLGQPYFELMGRSSTSTRAVESFRRQAAAVQQSADEASRPPQQDAASLPASETSTPASAMPQSTESELHARMEAYNRNIFQNRQTGLRDVFSYSSSVTDFDDTGLSDNMASVLTIPKMQVELPVYIGSSTENMSRGATIMNQTSMPIGGTNTNCVIAAHRMGGFFGDIELLETGDEVTIQNLWEKLTYRVVKIIVIDPYDIDKVRIQPGRDMITLLTCHPYWSNATRYIVYCERDLTGTGESLPTSPPETDVSTPVTSPSEQIGMPPSTQELSLPDGIAYDTSQSTIQGEHIVRIGGMIVSFILFVVLFVFLLRRRQPKAAPSPGDPPA